MTLALTPPGNFVLGNVYDSANLFEANVSQCQYFTRLSDAFSPFVYSWDIEFRRIKFILFINQGH